jgi:hypothetical protein
LPPGTPDFVGRLALGSTVTFGRRTSTGHRSAAADRPSSFVVQPRGALLIELQSLTKLVVELSKLDRRSNQRLNATAPPSVSGDDWADLEDWRNQKRIVAASNGR